MIPSWRGPLRALHVHRYHRTMLRDVTRCRCGMLHRSKPPTWDPPTPQREDWVRKVDETNQMMLWLGAAVVVGVPATWLVVHLFNAVVEVLR